MKDLKNFTIQIFSLILAMAASYFSLSMGWGLEIKSWRWWIGCGFFGIVFARMVSAIGDAKDKKEKDE